MERVWLLFGAKGWIGSMVLELLNAQKETVYIAESRSDNIKDVEEEIQRIKPTHVVSWIERENGKNPYTNSVILAGVNKT